MLVKVQRVGEEREGERKKVSSIENKLEEPLTKKTKGKESKRKFR